LLKCNILSIQKKLETITNIWAGTFSSVSKVFEEENLQNATAAKVKVHAYNVPLQFSIHPKEHLDLKIENHLKENLRNSLKRLNTVELTSEIFLEEIVVLQKNSLPKPLR
jgi:ATP sulfurylase